MGTRKRSGTWTPTELQEAYDIASSLVREERWSEAIQLARALGRSDPKVWRSAVNAGGFLIDAGAARDDRRMIAQAVLGIERELENVQEQSLLTAHYNLANGYSALGYR